MDVSLNSSGLKTLPGSKILSTILLKESAANICPKVLVRSDLPAPNKKPISPSINWVPIASPTRTHTLLSTEENISFSPSVSLLVASFQFISAISFLITLAIPLIIPAKVCAAFLTSISEINPLIPLTMLFPTDSQKDLSATISLKNLKDALILAAIVLPIKVKSVAFNPLTKKSLILSPSFFQSVPTSTS